jgi:predicted dehydrogenase
MTIAEPRAWRVGLLGTENSHAELVVRHLNVERRFEPWRVTVLAGPDDTRDQQLSRLGTSDDLVPDMATSHESMVGHVDAVIVTDRDGGRHRDHAMPFLEDGIPVLVDKPLATSVDDAEAIIAAARAGNALLTSYSALRWAPTVETLAREVRSARLQPAAAFAVGPAEIDSPHGGVFYYGVHPVEAICHVLPGPFGSVTVNRNPKTLAIHTKVGDVAVTIALLEPAEGEWAPFHLTVAGRNEVSGGDVKLPPDYLAPGLERFFAMIDSGAAPLSDAEMLRPVLLLDAIRAAMRDAADA